MTFPSLTQTFHKAPYPRISPTNPSLSCVDKTVVITGGGRGIGRAITKNFFLAGANVFIIGRSKASLKDTAAELSTISSANDSSSKVRVAYQAADVSDQDSVQSALSAAVKQFGGIDIVVNNAGYLDAHKVVAESDLSDYWRCYEVNVKAGIVVLQEFLRHAKLGATFINISSGVAHIPYYHGFSAYASSKMAFARVCEMAQGENPEVRIFSVQPGSIETDMARKVSNLEETLGTKADDDIGMSPRVMMRDGTS